MKNYLGIGNGIPVTMTKAYKKPVPKNNVSKKRSRASHNSKMAANQDGRQQQQQQHNLCNKAFAVRHRIVIVLLCICIFGLIADNWFTESYGSNPLSYISRADSAHNKRIYLHLSLYASGSERHDFNNTPQYNIETEEGDTCEVPRFDPESSPSPIVSCKRPKPRTDSCLVAHQVFHSTPKPTCKYQQTYKICDITQNGGDFHVSCVKNLCKQSITLGRITPEEGMLKWTLHPTTVHLENFILNQIVSTPKKPNYGFCFIRCTLANKTIARQLLLLPQNIAAINDNKHPGATSVNIIWLDSTSHSHFFRSLPQTVKRLQQIRDHQEAHVYNYNLMQSMKGGTYVNTVAFTSGTIKKRKYLLDHHSPIGNMFRIFKSDGYHTMWVDDLCWMWSIQKCACGIPKFLGKSDNPDAWKNIKDGLRIKGVDQIDISLSNCEIMRENNITDPFKDSVSICYNGHYQSHYIMSSLEMIQKQLNHANKPFFHYVDLNLGHESSGRRIQTLDESLANYVQHLSTLNNTITLMFGDHGNKYGTFVQKSRESKIEMAHPVLFLLASKNIEQHIGAKNLHSLQVNQDRMVNILDLRHTLLTLTPGPTNYSVTNAKKYDVNPKGLFIPISPNRTCKSMGIEPEAGKCICEKGVPVPGVTNTTDVLLLAEFAVGHINNIIQEQFKKANPKSKTGFGNCQRLVPIRVTNIFKTVDKNEATLEFDVHVHGGGITEDEDIYALVFELPVTTSSNRTFLIKLTHFERITTYSVYDKCRDKGVAGHVCVCALKSPIKKPDLNVPPNWHLGQMDVLGHTTTLAGSNDCIYLYERRTIAGLVLEASSDCIKWKFSVSVSVPKRHNIISSKSFSSISANLDPGMMVFLVAFIQCDPRERWHLEYDIKFRQM